MARRIPLRGGPLQDAIVKLAQGKSWRCAHFHPLRHPKGFTITPASYDGKGWPDLILVRERMIVAEVKGDGDTLSDEQISWLEALDQAGVETYVWKPKDWFDGSIDRILK